MNLLSTNYFSFMSMEGVLKQKEAAEEQSKWKDLKEQAVSEADAIIEQIEGFSEISSTEQVSALKEAINGLAESNDNRFIAEEIANKIPVIEEEVRHAERMMQLGVAV